ncbi:ABC transporter permease [Sinomicrobium weinanense]|uniref:ABC transporter permease n=1 Tax=Sinomicrobium weinanense TaxID=2842200 RepID=A0A926Q433_9FLAO|nr:FtsX-like permease family protein [Sinomicrobium weinanense]MBC9796646.1 ABC transporter permease [Sinomicrobium weinanense]MBU3124895.1 ABC transporter permease [Sinomicrobium weinanense]
MNLEFFIAKRIIKSKDYKSSVSAPIIKIAIMAIAIGLVVMLVAIATGVGLKHKIREKIAAFNGHIQIYNYDNNESEVSVLPVSINQEFYPEFKNIEGISHIQAVAAKAGIIRMEDTFEGIITKGVGKDYDWKYFKEYLREGRLPDYSGKLNNEVLMSRYLADRLQLKVGDTFNAFFLKDEGSTIPNQRVFEITGIYDSGFQEFDAKYIFTDIRHIQRMNRWAKDEVGSFEVFVNDFDDIEEKGNEVYGKTLSTLDSETILDKYPSIFEWLGMFDFNIAVIIGILIIVGGFNMITALLVLILERTQMIGILKALGSDDWTVRKIFLYNAAYLIAVGIFWGNVIGIGLLLLQKYFGFVSLDPETYYVTEAPVYISPVYIVLLNIGTLLLCLVMLLVPSYIITKIVPAKAMRFD